MKLMERAPQRVAAILSQPVGHRPDRADYMYGSSAGTGSGLKEFLGVGREVSMATIEQYWTTFIGVRPDFVYSASLYFAKSCQTPTPALPDYVVAHPLQVSIDIASLAPNAEITVFPWRN